MALLHHISWLGHGVSINWYWMHYVSHYVCWARQKSRILRTDTRLPYLKRPRVIILILRCRTIFWYVVNTIFCGEGIWRRLLLLTWQRICNIICRLLWRHTLRASGTTNFTLLKDWIFCLVTEPLNRMGNILRILNCWNVPVLKCRIICMQQIRNSFGALHILCFHFFWKWYTRWMSGSSNDSVSCHMFTFVKNINFYWAARWDLMFLSSNMIRCFPRDVQCFWLLTNKSNRHLCRIGNFTCLLVSHKCSVSSMCQNLDRLSNRCLSMKRHVYKLLFICSRL